MVIITFQKKTHISWKVNFLKKFYLQFILSLNLINSGHSLNLANFQLMLLINTLIDGLKIL